MEKVFQYVSPWEVSSNEWTELPEELEAAVSKSFTSAQVKMLLQEQEKLKERAAQFTIGITDKLMRTRLG